MGIEIIFAEPIETRLSVRHLNISIDTDSRVVRWDMSPNGEQGRSVAFADMNIADRFVEGLAHAKGFTNKIAEICLERSF